MQLKLLTLRKYTVAKIYIYVDLHPAVHLYTKKLGRHFLKMESTDLCGLSFTAFVHMHDFFLFFF